MTERVKTSELLSLSTNIVAAHVSNNSVAVSDLPQLIRDVYETLSAVQSGGERESERPTPAVPIKRSVTPDYIVCLDDGKKLKMLKRHLKTAYNMTPDEYRERWAWRRIIRWWRRITPSSAANWPNKSGWARGRDAAGPNHRRSGGRARINRP